MQKTDNAVSDRYWRKPMDARKQALVFARNIWKLIPGIIIGALLGALLWKGYHLITTDGYSLGWGKLSNNIMKNHYPKGLRRQLQFR